MNFYQEYFSKISTSVESFGSKTIDFARCVEIFHNVKRTGGKVIVAGNGGSAAIASHVTVDFTKAAKLRALNFNEASLITCFGNDYGYEEWVEKAIDAYADSEDLIILISSSGKSPNIINAAKHARAKKLKLLTFSGFSPENPLRALGDINFWVNSTEYNIVEMTHHIWLLALVDKYIDENKKS